MTTTDWRGLPRVSDPARSPSQPLPLQKNGRAPLACERCFKRKQKCDRLRPACTSCADLGVDCIARSQQFDFNAEDTGLTHARVNGYVESLRRRVAELEQKVKIAEQQHVQARRSFGASDVISPITGKRRRSTEVYIPVLPSSGPAVQNGDEQSTVEDTMSAIGLLSNKAMAESRVNTGDEPHKLAIIESIAAALAVDGRDPFTASTSHHVSLENDQTIPLTRDITLPHLQRFLDWSVWLPYIDERRLMEQYDTVVDSTDKAALPRFNAYMAIAIGISMSLASSMGRPFSITDDDIAVSIPEPPVNDDESGLPAQVRNKLALSRHLIVHAQLISDICGREKPSALFSYSNLCFWREFPPTNNPDYLDQLACRAMILIVNPPSTTLGDPQIKTDTITSCKRLIETQYTKSRTVSFLDAYNILAAAVAYICLSQPNQQGFAQTFEVVSKASVLLTQCSTRFSGLSVFQQFLLSLSTKIMEGQGSLEQYLDFIPPEIPIHLRSFVQNYASSGPLAA
ncbi:hypothetical protein NW768_011180 [Fusarium equiseti]|uniref:Zn(2)-C6 fungal-type domain-containing protein n=1 Tax=Fusarium equiseti TaxID=61235 RepID=A0ABQ8QY41_FUSEQ|nr:hypothetical protein NW768_011180 [Fusarium equiseti]